METILTVPLVCLASAQCGVLVWELLPRPVSLPFCQFLRKTAKNPIVRSAGLSVVFALLSLCALSAVQASQTRSSGRESLKQEGIVKLVDHLRAQVTFVLTLGNVLLLFAAHAICELTCQVESSTLNLAALKKQAQGLQAEYERVTKAETQSEEFTAMKKQIEKLIQDRAAAQAEAVEAKDKVRSADARVDAMQKQFKGLDREFDRVLDENKQLRAAFERANVALPQVRSVITRSKDE